MLLPPLRQTFFPLPLQDTASKYAQLPVLGVSALAGNDQIVIDFTNGDPLPTVGITLSGDIGNDPIRTIGDSPGNYIEVNDAVVLFGTKSIS
ncbi:MAG: hypothetical protein NTU53_01520 [Planctomycetota bacterium]|nr:hypothetical protein [Planctomycetota bacterium]